MARWISPSAGRVCVVAAIWVALATFCAAPASAQCGQTINVEPRQSLGLGSPPLAIGDSVLYDAAEALSAYGFQTNAMVCRTMAQGIVWLEQHDRNLPVLVVVALGTNGAVTTGQIDQLLSIVGPNRLLALVTPHDGNYAYVPGLFRSEAQAHPGQILLLDWDRLSAGHPDWFAPDGIHLGGTAGIDAYARLVASALQGPSASAPASTSAGAIPTVPTTIGAPHTIQPSTPVPPARPRVSDATRLTRLIAADVDTVRRWLAGI